MAAAVTSIATAAAVNRYMKRNRTTESVPKVKTF